MSDKQTSLIDRKLLGVLHPALKDKWRLDWLIRTRKIPIVKIGRRVYFDEPKIKDWIEKHKIQPDTGIGR